MRHPSCFLLEARTEVLQDESDVNVDKSSYEREWDEKSRRSLCIAHRQLPQRTVRQAAQ